MNRSYQLHPVPLGKSNIDYATALNAQQYSAVTSSPGAALVIAGAGSGKTRTLTYRVSWLLEQGYAAEQILLLTFTNKAAREMLERVNALLPGRASNLWGGTFHSIGHRILRQHSELLGYPKNFTIMDRNDQEDLLESVITRKALRGPDKRFPKANVLAEIISLCSNTGETLHALLLRRYRYFLDLEKQLEEAMLGYDAAKKAANTMDFDDLLTKTEQLFLTHHQVANSYQQQFRAILVDEYQDTNFLQASLIDLLAAGHKHLMVVGDDAQSIYSWRGANVSNILEFSKRYPSAQLFPIETNYRSVPQILKLANASILCNTNQFPKELHAVRPPYVTQPALVPLATNNEQASFIGQRLLELHEEGIPFSEMSILYRAHYHSMEIQMELTRRGIPFYITSGLRFFEQAHIKDVAAMMKFALNPNDEVAFKRLIQLFPGVGKKTAESLWRQTLQMLQGSPQFEKLLSCKPPAKATKQWHQCVHTLMEITQDPRSTITPAVMIETILLAFYDDIMKEKFTNYDVRRDDLQTLLNSAKQFSDPGEFLVQLTLLGESEEQLVADEDQVCLSSIHQAKGLEWRVVFLVWLTEGMFPTARSLSEEDSLEEERRLFYVAVTRCKEELYLTYPELRLHANYGEAFQRPSRFLSELKLDLDDRWDVYHQHSI